MILRRVSYFKNTDLDRSPRDNGRNAQRTNKNTGGQTPGRLNGRVESSGNSPTACSGIRGTQEPRQRARQHSQQHSGPGNRGAITGRDHAHPGRAERGSSSRQHRRPTAYAKGCRGAPLRGRGGAGRLIRTGECAAGSSAYAAAAGGP